MNQLNEITDDEFIPFLNNLGVDTYKKSFEWMLNDPDFSEVLRWLYTNINHNNALTPREEYRYIEIERRQNVVSESDLKASIEAIQEEYEGICLPGELDKLADVKLDITFQKEKLYMLEKHEKSLQDLVTKNEAIKDEITLEVSHLHAGLQQGVEDEKMAGDECLRLAEETETLTDEVMDMMTNTLDLIGRTQSEKDTAKLYFTFGPFEEYLRAQALFRSHFDLYTSRTFQLRPGELSDEDLKHTCVEAKTLEKRLLESIQVYVESRAALAGERGKWALVSQHAAPHPSQVVSQTMEAESSLSLLRQQENIALQQLRAAVACALQRRADAVDAAVGAAAAAVRERYLSAAVELSRLSADALCLDRCVCALARTELRALAERLHLAHSWRRLQLEQLCRHAGQLESMKKIIAEQAICEEKLQSNDYLMTILSKILNLSSKADAHSLVTSFEELKLNVADLKSALEEKYRRKEDDLEEYKSSLLPLSEFALQGKDSTIACLAHALRLRMADVDKKVLEAGAQFTEVKNGDQHNLRRLWQWFLAEPARLLAAAPPPGAAPLA